MQKSLLESFIRRYSLNGVCEPAHWYSDAENKTLIARAHTNDKTVILKVLLKNWEGLETCSLAIPSSTKIKSMLSPIGEDITITLNKVKDRIVNFTISDDDCEAVCTVADYDAFPETLDVDSETDNIPSDFEVEVILTDSFIERMMKGIAAINESKDFVLVKNKRGGLDMVINYEDTNTNRIRIPVETVEGKNSIDVLYGFSTPVFKYILSTNENKKVEPTDEQQNNPPPAPPILRVSDRGIAIIGFEDDTFKTKYFLFPTRIIE